MRFNPPASYLEYIRQNGDVTIVEMTSILVATFSFLTFKRNHLERPATSQIKITILKSELKNFKWRIQYNNQEQDFLVKRDHHIEF